MGLDNSTKENNITEAFISGLGLARGMTMAMVISLVRGQLHHLYYSYMASYSFRSSLVFKVPRKNRTDRGNFTIDGQNFSVDRV